MSVNLEKRKNLIEKLVKDKSVHNMVKKEMIRDLELKSLQNEDDSTVLYQDEPLQSILKKWGSIVETNLMINESQRFLRDFEIKDEKELF